MKMGGFLLAMGIFFGVSKTIGADATSGRAYTQAEVLELLREVDAAKQIISLQRRYITALEHQIDQRDKTFAIIPRGSRTWDRARS